VLTSARETVRLEVYAVDLLVGVAAGGNKDAFIPQLSRYSTRAAVECLLADTPNW
jgi:hypothetical protein